MIENQIRELFAGLAGARRETTRVDAERARRRGRARLRWRRAAVTGTPLLAVATAVTIAVTLGFAPAYLHQDTTATGTGPAAPRQFDPLVPYLSFGWLPAGNSLLRGGVSRTSAFMFAGRTATSPNVWDLGIYAAGRCHLTSGAKKLTCGSAGPTIDITRPAPAVHGHRAWWTNSSNMWWADAGLVWQYARNGWAWLILPNMYRYPPQQVAAVRRDAVRIAAHIRYGAPTRPLVFPAQLVHVPGNWRVSSVLYTPDGRVLQASSFALAGGRPSLGSDGGLDYQKGLPTIGIGPDSPKSTCPRRGESNREVINGVRVVVSHSAAGGLPRQDLCAAHADGLTLFVSEQGAHPAIGVASLFRNHLRLLGGNPANWARNPFG